jgi:hypothetical protein
MNEKKNYTFLVRMHQLVILVLFVFSLFVKEEIKKVFWLIIGSAALSLVIQTFVYRARPGSYGSKQKQF